MGHSSPNDPKTGADETGAEHIGGVKSNLGGLVRNGTKVAANQPSASKMRR